MSSKLAVAERVRDAVLKVLFRSMAVPVPDALAALVMLIVELLEAVVVLDPDPPWIVKRPE